MSRWPDFKFFRKPCRVTYRSNQNSFGDNVQRFIEPRPRGCPCGQQRSHMVPKWSLLCLQLNQSYHLRPSAKRSQFQATDGTRSGTFFRSESGSLNGFGRKCTRGCHCRHQLRSVTPCLARILASKVPTLRHELFTGHMEHQRN